MHLWCLEIKEIGQRLAKLGLGLLFQERGCGSLV